MPFTAGCCDRLSVCGKGIDEREEEFCQALREADRVIVGAGAGFSAAAGQEYGGERFSRNFGDFASRYGIEDMYAGMFYHFATEEERWAYTARHVLLNRYDNDIYEPLYELLLKLLEGKDYFVITTNVDGLFGKSGFAADRIFEVQGDYGYMQCGDGCHDGLYDNESLVRKMADMTADCHIPSTLVPHCPECGGRMELHIRKDFNFVEDKQWFESLKRYQSFAEKAGEGKTLLIELGVGFNTPTIIRYPFERMAAERDGVTLVRLNRDYPGFMSTTGHHIPFAEDIGGVLRDVAEKGLRQPSVIH